MLPNFICHFCFCTRNKRNFVLVELEVTEKLSGRSPTRRIVPFLNCQPLQFFRKITVLSPSVLLNFLHQFSAKEVREVEFMSVVFQTVNVWEVRVRVGTKVVFSSIFSIPSCCVLLGLRKPKCFLGRLFVFVVYSVCPIEFLV